MARKNTKKRMRQPEAIQLEPDLFADEFFSEPPKVPAAEPTWDEPEDRPKIAADKRRAMVATISIFSVFAVGLGSFLIYTQWVMPTPVALGAAPATFTLPEAPAYAPPTTTTPPIASAPFIAMAHAPAVVEPAVVKPPSVAPAVVEPAVVKPPSVAPAVVEPARVEAPVVARKEPRPSRHVSAPQAVSAPADPNNLSAQAMRALNSGQASDARRLAQQAVQANPERADGWIVLGAAHDALGDHTAAMTAYASCTARAFGPRVATCRALAR